MSGFEPRNPYDETAIPADEAAFAGPNLTEEQRFGAQCESLLGSEAYKVVMSRAQDIVWQAFVQCPLRDTEGLLQLRMRQKAITDLHAMLEDAAKTGTMAAIQLEQQQRLTEKDG